MRGDIRAELLANPFFVLELSPRATRAEVERAAQRILGLLEIKPSAKDYQSPLGPAVRDADLVRASAATLRDPDQRLLHEVWAMWLTEVRAPGFVEPPSWPQAGRSIGWKAPWPIR